MTNGNNTPGLLSTGLEICCGMLAMPLHHCQGLMVDSRLTAVERRLIWEQGPGQELRENSAGFGMLGLSVALIMLSMADPVLQWMYVMAA